MKALHLAVFLGALFLSIAPGSAQVTSAGQLTRRIAPLTGRPAPASPAPAQPGGVAVAPAAVPADPAKVEAGKVEGDKKKFEFEKKKAEQGAPYAQYDLGMRYINGDGVEQNYELGKKWITAASTNGYKAAIKKLEDLKKQEKENAAK